MLVKICGIKTIEAASVAVQARADFIGFVFAESKRKITPDQAAEIARPRLVVPSARGRPAGGRAGGRVHAR